MLDQVAKENLLRSFIRNAIERGLSASRAYEQIRGTELGIRKQRFLALYREEAGKYSLARYALRAPDWLIPSEKILPGLKYKPAEAYLFRAHVYFYDEETGRVRSQYVTFVTDVLSSKKAIEQEIRETLAELYRGYRERVTKVVLHEWWKKA